MTMSHTGWVVAGAVALAVAASARAAETLYNGIVLPAEWPPRAAKLTREPLSHEGLAAERQADDHNVGRLVLVVGIGHVGRRPVEERTP